ncbi:MAG: YbaY family lipoprotein [Gemmatimonadales bacterium]|jgi:uncharacterized lipoprotein YbaY
MNGWSHASTLAVATLLAVANGCSPPMATVSGAVTYRERIALTPDATLEVTLVDVSRADIVVRAVGGETGGS